jgi:hypothetical protein
MAAGPLLSLFLLCLFSIVAAREKKSANYLAVVLTRKAVLLAWFLEHLLSRLGESGFQVAKAFSDALDCFLKVTAFPCQIFSKRDVERGRGVLTASLRVFREPGHSPACDRNYFHVLRPGIAKTDENTSDLCLARLRFRLWELGKSRMTGHFELL